MLKPDRIRCSRLRKLVKKGDQSGIQPEWRGKVQRVLAALNVAVHPSELDVPGFKWHELKGDRKGTFSVRVSANWRITYKWDTEGPYDVDLEDYHGT